MKYDWFRLHSEARNDKKLASLSDAQFRIWFALLCYANEQDGALRGGFRDDDREYLALEVTNGNEVLLAETLERMIRLRMLERSADDSGVLFFCGWERRQYDNPSDAPQATRERKARSRERSRDKAAEPAEAAEKPADSDASRDVTTGHDLSRAGHDHTRAEQNRAEQNIQEQTTAEESVRGDDAAADAAPIDTPTEADSAAADSAADPAAAESQDFASLVSELRAAGLNRKPAEEYARRYPDECRRQLAYLPSHSNLKNPGAYLNEAIPGKYAPPPGFSGSNAESGSAAPPPSASKTEFGTDDWQRAIARYLRDVPPSRLPDLRRRALNRLAEIRPNVRPDGHGIETIAQYMAKAWGYDQRGHADVTQKGGAAATPSANGGQMFA